MLKRSLIFIAALGALILGIKILGWLPLAIDDKGLRHYKSIEEAQESVGIREVLLPTYFPQRLKWPPSEIFGAKIPSPSILMHFKDRESGLIVLSIRIEGEEEEKLRSRIEPETISRENTIRLKDREAVLSIGRCPDGSPCNMLRWPEGPYTVTVVSKDPVTELLKISESML